MAKPMERIGEYITLIAGGGIHIDTEGMAIDLIMAAKAGGATKEQFMKFVENLFDECHVEIGTTKPVN